MVDFRCDLCGGVLLHEETHSFVHADPKQCDHLPFPVPRISEDKPGDLQTGDPVDEEGGPPGRQDE